MFEFISLDLVSTLGRLRLCCIGFYYVLCPLLVHLDVSVSVISRINVLLMTQRRYWEAATSVCLLGLYSHILSPHHILYTILPSASGPV